MVTLLQVSFCSFIILLLLLFLVRLLAARRTMTRRRMWRVRQDATVVGFFHPYANAGGGGERVLWHSVSALLVRHSSLHCVVYSGDTNTTGDQILERVKSRFGIHLSTERVHFVFLNLRWLVEASTWPRFTLAGQSLGSAVLGLEAFYKLIPDVYFDSMGYAFTYPLFKWIGSCTVVAYVHYPVVSTDMLQAVASRKQAHNNAGSISRSHLFTRLKVMYYKLFAIIYSFMGRRAHIVMVNSSWTKDHIQSIWQPRSLHVVFPPCDTEAFSSIQRQPCKDQFRIVSIGQYRPEKDHKKQLKAVRSILDKRPSAADKLRLIIIGSCRDEGDRKRVKELKELSHELELEQVVEFRVNLAFDDLLSQLGSANAALHTMWNEHFGIGLVECMAAGCVMVGHRSGGPLRDIVLDWEGRRTGLLAESAEEFSDCLLEVMDMSEEERLLVTTTARVSCQRFSVTSFDRKLLTIVDKLL